MKRFLVALLLILSSQTVCHAADKLVWSDEFDGPAGAPPDPTKWNLETGGHGWGAGELQHYTDLPANAHLDGHGHMILTAREEDRGPWRYTSARLDTRGHVDVRYGTVEVRLKVPKAKGLGPSFWLMPTDWSWHGRQGAAWPKCGEIDVIESYGDDVSRAVMSIVSAQRNNPREPFFSQESYWFPKGSGADFHVYRFEWQPAEMRWLIDGVVARRARPEWFGGEWVYDQHRWHLVFTLAVGGERPWGMPDDSTPFPSEMVIDDVRVYSSHANK